MLIKNFRLLQDNDIISVLFTRSIIIRNVTSRRSYLHRQSKFHQNLTSSSPSLLSSSSEDMLNIFIAANSVILLFESII